MDQDTITLIRDLIIIVFVLFAFIFTYNFYIFMGEDL